MIFLLDTNVVIAIVNRRPLQVRQRYRRAEAEGALIWVPSVVLFELWYGISRSRRQVESEDQLGIFFSGRVQVAPFDGEDAVIAGELRAQLEGVGTPIGPYDTLIAAQALRMGATLVTANVAEFSRVPGLRWEDWTNG